jgi:hypothetical protein
MNLNHSQMGHAHFWERAMTRRKFLGSAALAGGAAATAGIWLPEFARAAAFAESDPRFIPGGTKLPFQPTPFHFFFPTGGPPGAVTVLSGHGDPSLITDFDGMIGVADVGDTMGTEVGTGTRMHWKADVRFMKGTYVGTQGDTRTGAFAFV